MGKEFVNGPIPVPVRRVVRRRGSLAGQGSGCSRGRRRPRRQHGRDRRTRRRAGAALRRRALRPGARGRRPDHRDRPPPGGPVADRRPRSRRGRHRLHDRRDQGRGRPRPADGTAAVGRRDAGADGRAAGLHRRAPGPDPMTATAFSSAPPPPLPEFGELVDRSEWLRARPGLEAEVRRWHRSLGAERRRIAAEAEDLARPRLSRLPVLALFLVTVRFLWFSLQALFRRTATPERRAVRWSKHLVQAGGPAYVKLGQLIATAQGALPEAWTDAFAWCRDEVPPLRPGTAVAVIDRELGRRRAETFESIEARPVAAASIAQVHLGRLADGTEVAVKVQRPGLRRRFELDIRVLAVIGAVADRVSKRARIANLPGFVELFAQLVLEELDFRLEALNMAEIGLANEDAGLGHIRIPRPIPGLLTTRVLVMERVPGIRYTDAAAAHPELDGRRIVRLAVQGVLEHALLYGVFHGDLHAGNVLIDEAGNFSLVDVGIAGRVDAARRAALARLVIGFARNDFAGQVAAVAEF